MSKAACAKKIRCNYAARSAVDSADRIVFEVIAPAIESGDLSPAKGKSLIMAFAAADEAYIAEIETLVSDTMDAFGD